MNRKLAFHLWESPEVRAALKKELLRLVVYVVVGIASVAGFRHFRDKPVAEGVLSTSIGMVGVVLVWLISAIRTVREVLRENGYSER